MMGRPKTPRITLAAAVAAVTLVGVGIPASPTAAFLTVSDTATAAAGLGDWCAVPNPELAKNVYRLSEFTEVKAPASADPATGTNPVRMLVLPVVNDGSFDPVEPLPDQVGGVDDQLGVRLWSCTQDMSSTAGIKLTAWRGDYASTDQAAFVWDVAPSASIRFANARLNAEGTPALDGATTAATKPGMQLRDLHRGINTLGGVTEGADPVTMRYSWLLSTGRDKFAGFTADPSCTTADCHADGGPGVGNFNTVFSGDDASSAAYAVSANSSTYLAEKYSKQFQCRYRNVNATFDNTTPWVDTTGPCTPKPQHVYESRIFLRPVPTVVQPAGGMSADSLLRDSSGTKIHYVVLEWWSPGAPPADLEVEVFVK